MVVVVLVEEREGEEEERLEASVIGRNRGGEIGGPPLNVNVEKSQTVCQALTVHRYRRYCFSFGKNFLKR